MASFTYKLLKKAGLNFSEGEYSNVSLYFVIKRLITRYKNAILLEYCMHSIILLPFNSRTLRARMWRWIGAKIGKNVFIGYEVLMDTTYAELIELEDNVHIASRSTLLCHQRDLSNYFQGDDYSKLPYIKGKIILKKGCLISTGCMIMPGVTVGEGSIVGAFSLVTKDIPAWSIATGRPAKVVRSINKKEE